LGNIGTAFGLSIAGGKIQRNVIPAVWVKDGRCSVSRAE